MPSIPLHISALFISLVFALAFLILIVVYIAGTRAKLPAEEHRNGIVVTIVMLLVWLAFTLIIATSGFLADFTSMPPHLLLVTLPPLIFILVLVSSKTFIALTEHFNIFWLVYAQSFRILMEFILWLLYRYNVISVQMTFEGYNFDILVGITAPFVAYYCFVKKTWSPKVALVWNFAGILLLANIVILALLSTPYPFRQFMNEPANTIVFYFPFVWLPAFVVPVALFMHLIAIRRLLKK